jgi:hypothetical protein
MRTELPVAAQPQIEVAFRGEDAKNAEATLPMVADWVRESFLDHPRYCHRTVQGVQDVPAVDKSYFHQKVD